METVLIIEDDPAMLRGLKDNFEQRGFSVLTAADGEKGLEAALDAKPDLIILDIMLPKVNGYEICRLVRAEKLDMPILMLTAKGEESDVVLGLNLGADDYMTKPFGIKELLARVNAFLRRRRQGETTVHLFGSFTLDTSACLLAREGEPVKLTPKEYRMLCCLLENQGRVLTRDTLLNSVWGYNCFVTSRSVDRCITTLRNKIETDPHAPQHILTIRDFGYKFQANNDSC